MDSYVIGIDIGTGSVKALAVDAKGAIIASAQQAYPLIQPDDVICEQDPHLIWKAFAACLKSVIAELKHQPRAVSLSCAMHSVLLLDGANKPLTNSITWADNRAARIAERVQHSAIAEMLYEQTGAPIHAMTPLCKIIWFREHHQKIFAQARKFISIKEFLWLKLFNAFEVDYSIAGAAGLFDITALTWNSNALHAAGIDKSQLSDPVNTNYTRANITPEAQQLTGLNLDVPFVIGSSDGCMANLGSFATTPGLAALTIGTSGAIRIASDKPIFNFGAMTFNYRLDERTFISGGPTNNGGVVLKWYAEHLLKHQLNNSADYSTLINSIATTPPGADGLIFLPYVLGERAPIWNSDAQGIFYGLRMLHTRDHMTRAVVEGISMALYNIGENMERTGVKIDQINVSGGFIHSTEWLQIMSNIFGKKICLINASDASALGAAYLAMKKIGMIRSYDEMKTHTRREILPDADIHRIYQDQYRKFQQIYQLLLPIIDEND